MVRLVSKEYLQLTVILTTKYYKGLVKRGMGGLVRWNTCYLAIFLATKIIWLSMKRGMVGLVRMEYLLPGNIHYSSTWTQRLSTSKETICGLVDKKLKMNFHLSKALHRISRDISIVGNLYMAIQYEDCPYTCTPLSGF
jgi:hypothetical protein